MPSSRPSCNLRIQAVESHFPERSDLMHMPRALWALMTMSADSTITDCMKNAGCRRNARHAIVTDGQDRSHVLLSGLVRAGRDFARVGESQRGLGQSRRCLVAIARFRAARSPTMLGRSHFNRRPPWHRTSFGPSDGGPGSHTSGFEASPLAGRILVQYTLRLVMVEEGNRRNREHLASTSGAAYNCLMCKVSISHSYQRNPGHRATTYVESAM